MRTALLAASFLAAASAARADALDDYVNAQMAARHTPAVSIAVVDQGKVVLFRNYGMADVARRRPAGSSTVYELASLTKPLTATGVMLLVQDGKIDLDAPVATYLPDAPATWRGVTVRRLLSHTSGLPDYINDRLTDQTRDTTAAAITAQIAAAPLAFAPGDRWAYSNSNYLVLGRIIEAVSGQSWDGFLTLRIFQPLGMTVTARRDAARPGANRAHGYAWEKGKLIDAWPLNPTVWDNADGGLVSSTADLARLAVALQTGSLLRPDTLAAMRTAAVLPGGETTEAGLGWEVRDVRGHWRYEHGGKRSGATTQFTAFDGGPTVIVLANAPFDAYEAAGAAAAQLDPMLGPVSMLNPVADNRPEATAAVRRWMQAVADGAANSPTMTPAFAAETLEDSIKPMKGLLGRLKTLQFLGRDTLGPNPAPRRGARPATVAYYRALTRDWLGREGKQDLVIYLTADGRVTDFDVVQSAPDDGGAPLPALLGGAVAIGLGLGAFTWLRRRVRRSPAPSA